MGFEGIWLLAYSPGPKADPRVCTLEECPLRTHFEEPLAGGPGCLLVPTARPARPDTSPERPSGFLRDPTLRECLHTIFCGGPWRGAASPEQFFQKSRFKPFKSNPINPEDACSRRFYKVVTPTDSGYGAQPEGRSGGLVNRVSVLERREKMTNCFEFYNQSSASCGKLRQRTR